MLAHSCILLITITLVSFSFAQDVSSTGTLPPILPLALKSPYLHAWTSEPNVTFSFPMFWNKDRIQWEGMIRVDDHAYQWLGKSSDANPEPANLTSTRLTPTSTIFTYRAGPAQLTATFLSPIESSDPIKQSIPFSYVALNVSFVDGAQHSVKLYMDINGEWLAAGPLELMTWSSNVVGSSSFHQIQRNSIQSLVENKDRAEDIISVIATQSGADVSVMSGLDRDCRVQFRDTGVVTGSSRFSAPAQVGFPYPVFSITKDLGTISGTSSPVVFAVGAYRNTSVSFVTSTGETQLRQPLFATKYGSLSEVVDAFLSDYADAQSRANALDARILGVASNTSDTYSNFVSLAMRQAMGGTELTIAKGSDGNWNMSDVKMFMKDVGNSNRTNPVEALYASFPFFLSINTTYAGQLLSPLLEFQNSPSNSQAYAARDIGNTYPKSTGDNTQHNQQVEHTSSMLIMASAYTKASQDRALSSHYYTLLRKWAEFLVSSTLNPPDSVTVDGEAQSRNTNLVLKGIVALKAMSSISSLLSQNDDSSRYSQFATDYTNQLLSLTLTSASNNGHLLPRPNANDQASWAQMYNMYADVLLGTNILNQTVYDAQTTFYENQLHNSNYGLPISSATTQGYMPWTFFTAATVSDRAVRESMIKPLWDYATLANNPDPLVANYSVNGLDGHHIAAGSPALGAIFAPLVFSLLTGGTSSNGSGGGLGIGPNGGGIPGGGSPGGGTFASGTTKAGVIAAGVAVPVVVISALALGFVFWRRRQRQRHSEPKMKKYPPQTPLTPVPFVSSVPRDGEYSPEILSASSKSRFAMALEDTPPVPILADPPRSDGPSETTDSESPVLVSRPSGEYEHPPRPLPRPTPRQSQIPTGVNGELAVLRAEVHALRQAMQYNGSVIEDAHDHLPPPSYTPRS